MSQLVSTQNTQFVVTRLIADILSQDEEGIKKQIDPNIKVTSVLNGSAPVVSEGQDEYLARIRNMWSRVVSYNYTAFLYGNFTPDSGDLHFTQIVVGKSDHGNEIILAEGTQTFAFKEGRVSAISVEEAKTVLTEEEYKNTIAKIKEQKGKIAHLAAQRICIIT